jgi:hypothetical protein
MVSVFLLSSLLNLLISKNKIAQIQPMPAKKMKTSIKDATNSMQETKKCASNLCSWWKFNARNLIVLQDHNLRNSKKQR